MSLSTILVIVATLLFALSYYKRRSITDLALFFFALSFAVLGVHFP